MMPRNIALFAALRIGLTPDEVHTILENERRRAVITELAETDETDHRGEVVLDVGELAERIAAAEVDVTREALTPQQRRRVYITLVQTHAPVLDNYDVVTYHERSKKIEAEPDVEALARVIEYVTVACGEIA